MRRGEQTAVQAFVSRFYPLLHGYSQRPSFPGADRDEFIGELLDDLAIQLMRPSAPTPQNLRLHVITAFRRRFLTLKRDRARRQRVIDEAAFDVALENDLTSASDGIAGCSHETMRASRAPDVNPPTLPGVLERLARALNEKLTPEERHLLAAVAENVPQRQIATWLGISHVVARKRLQRLRARLNQAAMQHANSLPPDEARELARFLRRCRVQINAVEQPGMHSTPGDSLLRERR